MMNLLQAAPGELLDALDGVAYATNRDGVLFLAGGADWGAFSTENGAFLPPSAMFGRNLFEIIDGDEVRGAYRAIHDKVIAGKSRLRFEYRCDGPAVERRMRMSMGPIMVGGEVAGVLYHSTLLKSVDRSPLAFLADDEALRRRRTTQGLPVATVCAWCADVADGSGVWLKPQAYEIPGGGAEVRLRHGICPICRAQVIAPLLGRTAASHP